MSVPDPVKHPPIFGLLVSWTPRSSYVVEFARNIFDAENPGWRARRRRAEIGRLWNHQRLPRFPNYRTEREDC
jgi:hypothetical protein